MKVLEITDSEELEMKVALNRLIDYYKCRISSDSKEANQDRYKEWLSNAEKLLMKINKCK